MLYVICYILRRMSIKYEFILCFAWLQDKFLFRDNKVKAEAEVKKNS